MISWSAIWGLVGIIMGLLLVIAIVSRDTKMWEAFGLGLLFFGVVGRSVMHSDLKDARASGKKWKLVDEGIQRVYAQGKEETIRWEQIRRMKWVRWTGMILRWEESKEEHQRRSGTFKAEFRYDVMFRQYRAVLRIDSGEARELVSVMVKKTGMSYEKLVA